MSEIEVAQDHEITFLRLRLGELERELERFREAKQLLAEASAFMRIFVQDEWIKRASEIVGSAEFKHERG